LAEDFADEKDLWSGRPVRIPFVLSTLVGSRAVFGLVYAGFSVLWMALVWQSGADFWLFGLPFFLMGVGVIFGSTVKRLLTYGNTEYRITDKRVINKTGADRLEYIRLERVQETSVDVGFLDKMFGTGTVRAAAPGRDAFVIDCVKEPHEVEEILQAAIRNSVSYCSKCDGVIPAGVSVCPYCGNVVAK
jgi:uncharacterized membrane protein YdbT with pleckstrin-like domain